MTSMTSKFKSAKGDIEGAVRRAAGGDVVFATAMPKAYVDVQTEAGATNEDDELVITLGSALFLTLSMDVARELRSILNASLYDYNIRVIEGTVGVEQDEDDQYECRIFDRYDEEPF